MKKLDMFNSYCEELSMEEAEQLNGGGGGHTIIYNAFHWLGHALGAYRTIPDSVWDGNQFCSGDGA